MGLFCFDHLHLMSFKPLLHLRPQDVVGCVCVNPGRLTKGQVGGTYGRLLIQRSTTSLEGKRVSPCSAAQVVKIWKEMKTFGCSLSAEMSWRDQGCAL